MGWIKRLMGLEGPTRPSRLAQRLAVSGGEMSAPPPKSVCPVCGKPCGLQFTKGKGKPYLACDDHKISSMLLKIHGDPRKGG